MGCPSDWQIYHGENSERASRRIELGRVDWKRLGTRVARRRCTLLILFSFCLLCGKVGSSPIHVPSLLRSTRDKVSAVFDPIGSALGRLRGLGSRQNKDHGSCVDGEAQIAELGGKESSGGQNSDSDGFSLSSVSRERSSLSSSSSCEAWDEREEVASSVGETAPGLWSCGLDSASTAPAAAAAKQAFQAWAEQVRDRWLGVLNATAAGSREYVTWTRDFMPWSRDEKETEEQRAEQAQSSAENVTVEEEASARAEEAVIERGKGVWREGWISQWWAVAGGGGGNGGGGGGGEPGRGRGRGSDVKREAEEEAGRVGSPERVSER
eukprot:1732257-Rhodomonas_salina.4